jgi:tetratricopeptide repeat protein 8
LLIFAADSEKFTCEPRLLLGLARIYDMLNDPESAITYYKKVLVLDASCVEAIACLGAHFFYSDQVYAEFNMSTALAGVYHGCHRHRAQ